MRLHNSKLQANLVLWSLWIWYGPSTPLYIKSTTYGYDKRWIYVCTYVCIKSTTYGYDRVWLLSLQRSIATIPAHDNPLAALSFNSAGNKIATASEKVRSHYKTALLYCTDTDKTCWSPLWVLCQSSIRIKSVSLDLGKAILKWSQLF